MLSKLAVTLAGLVFLVLLPAAEISDTHVFNPAWPEHARLHEVWQLCAHALLSGIALWLIWVKREALVASVIALAMGASFVFAYLIRESYGGSMSHADGEPVTALANAAVVVAAGVSALLIAGIFQEASSLRSSHLEHPTRSARN